MAKQRSEKSNYPSRYSPSGWVSGHQYITELICEKKATYDKKELPVKFWDLKEWNGFYRYQITLASSLVKEYSVEAVIAALKDNRCYKTYSLRSPFLRSIVEEYHTKQQIPRDVAQEDLPYDFGSKESFASNNKKKSIISKLQDLEDD
jgi:RNase H-fold protein (predicted Holliday junction resolvase)